MREMTKSGADLINISKVTSREKYGYTRCVGCICF